MFVNARKPLTDREK